MNLGHAQCSTLMWVVRACFSNTPAERWDMSNEVGRVRERVGITENTSVASAVTGPTPGCVIKNRGARSPLPDSARATVEPTICKVYPCDVKSRARKEEVSVMSQIVPNRIRNNGLLTLGLVLVALSSMTAAALTSGAQQAPAPRDVDLT